MVVLNGLAVGVGVIFLVFPGIYLLCRLIVCLPVALVEKLGASESPAREAFQLTRDNAGRAFMILLVFFRCLFGGRSK